MLVENVVLFMVDVSAVALQSIVVLFVNKVAVAIPNEVRTAKILFFFIKNPPKLLFYYPLLIHKT